MWLDLLCIAIQLKKWQQALFFRDWQVQLLLLAEVMVISK
jgi:hypothetical protein